jgi:diguanylate cyclase (GGDEF)-like protein
MPPKRNLTAEPARKAGQTRPHEGVSSRGLLRQFIDASFVGMLVVSESGAVLLANRAAEVLLERSEAELAAAPPGTFVPSAARGVRSLDAGRRLEMHSSTLRVGGRSVRLVSLIDVSDERQGRVHVDALLRRSRDRAEHLEHLASHDPLTGLLNRRGLALELARESQRRRRSGGSLAAVLIDCDDFKRVNDSLGHSGGDHALRELSRRLEDALRPSDRLGRIGGDEFLVLLPETRLPEAMAVAERLRLAVCGMQLPASSGVHEFTVSLGVESVTEDAPTLDALIALAENALRQSKCEGKNRSTASGAPAPSQARALWQGLRARTGFHAQERPIVRLADGAEVAWELEPAGPAGAFERPRDFLRSTLSDELLERIDFECLRLCLTSAGPRTATAELHVELLPSTLLRTPTEDLVEQLRRSAPEHGLCLEVSEQQFVGDPSALMPAVSALRSAGLRLALKDMSFGRSSLEALIMLEPDVVKLDARFVRLASSDVGRERALVRLARVVHSLGSELHAAGVDSESDLELLRSLGVTCGQGALWN